MNDSSQKMESPHSLSIWLWFWLGAYVIQLPVHFRDQWLPLLQDVFASYYAWSAGVSGEPILLALFMSLTNLIELLPYLMVFVGVLFVLLPQRRGRFVEWQFGFKTVEENAAV